jgi:ketosteroid isomerase-like protein
VYHSQDGICWGLEMVCKQQVISEIIQLVDTFNQGFKSKNIETVLSTLSSEFAFVGSEIFERASSLGQLHTVLTTIFARKDTYSWDWKRRDIVSFGRTAWLTADADILVLGDDVERYPYRITMVFVKRKGKWAIVQFHGSEPASE